MTAAGNRIDGTECAAARPPRGILGLPGRLPYRVTRTPPSAGLDWCVDRFWTSAWEIPPGRAVTAMVLPHPTVNLTFESTGSGWRTGPDRRRQPGRQLVITGVARGVFTRTLTGTDAVFGIKLRPGAARLLVEGRIADLSGTGQRADSVMPTAGRLERALLAAADDRQRIEAAEAFLAELPGPSEKLTLVQQAVQALTEDPSVRRVSDLTARLGVSERTLQRLFGEYLGLTPGWVLRRGRLHAAAERLIQLTGGGQLSGRGRSTGSALADVAAEYGYADQAHLTGDFTKIIGMPPSSWLSSLVAEHAAG